MYSFSPEHREGLRLFVLAHQDKSRSPSYLEFGPNAPLQLTGEQWDQQLFRSAVNAIRLWKNPPASFGCSHAENPNLAPDRGSISLKDEPIVGASRLLEPTGVSNFYYPTDERIEQVASIRFHINQANDDGSITSVLDLENSALQIVFTVPAAEVTRELRFCRLGFYAGHSVIAIDPRQLSQCASTLIVRLPPHISVQPSGFDAEPKEPDLCETQAQ